MAGRLTVGMSGLYNNDFPFINLLKRTHSRSASGGYAYPAILGATGYPASSPSTSIAESLTLPPVPTRLVLKWEGTCPIRLGASGSTTPRFVVHDGGSFVNGSVDFNLTTQGENGRVEFSLANVEAGLSVTFPSGSTYTNPANAALMLIEHEEDYDAGETFNPDFIAALEYLRFGRFRMMDWGPTNLNNATRFAHRHALGAWSYGHGLWVPGLWAGDTSGTDTYTLAAADDTPVAWTHGEVFQCRVVDANTTTAATIDVGSRGAKSIARYSGNLSLDAGLIAANSLQTFVYDGFLDRVLLPGPGAVGSINTYVPLEAQIALCNRLGVGIWYNIPPFFDLDSVEAAAAMIRDTLDTGLEAHIEYANEIWNEASGFEATPWARRRGEAIGWTPSSNRATHGFYALQARRMMEVVGDTWGARPGLKRVLAFQAFGDITTTRTYRMEGADLTLDAGGLYTTTPEDVVTDYTGTGQRPIDFVEKLSYADYTSGKEARAFDAQYESAEMAGLLAATDDHASGDAAAVASALDWLDADLRDEDGDETLPVMAGKYDAWNTVAATFSKTVDPYEGALEINRPGTSRLTAISVDTAYSAEIDAFYDDYKRDWRCHVYTRDRIEAFLAGSHAGNPVWFVAFGPGQWSCYADSLYSAEAERWSAGVAIRLHNGAPDGIRRRRYRVQAA